MYPTIYHPSNPFIFLPSGNSLMAFNHPSNVKLFFHLSNHPLRNPFIQPANLFCIDPFTHLPTFQSTQFYLSIQFFIRPFTQSSIHSWTFPFICSADHSFIHPSTKPFIHPSNNSSIHYLFIQPLIHSSSKWTSSFVHPHRHLFIIHSVSLPSPYPSRYLSFHLSLHSSDISSIHSLIHSSSCTSFTPSIHLSINQQLHPFHHQMSVHSFHSSHPSIFTHIHPFNQLFLFSPNQQSFHPFIRPFFHLQLFIYSANLPPISPFI